MIPYFSDLPQTYLMVVELEITMSQHLLSNLLQLGTPYGNSLFRTKLWA